MGATANKKAKKMPKQYLNWFEIPVMDMDRAVSFFNHLYGIQMQTNVLPEYAMALFPEATGVGGALVKGQGCIPSEAGPLLYLNAPEDMTLMLDRVKEAGGRVIMGKTAIGGEGGYFSLFVDSEGNRLALHANQ
jgi:predicted enzyme related to lactoylglutathione lyase